MLLSVSIDRCPDRPSLPRILIITTINMIVIIAS